MRDVQDTAAQLLPHVTYAPQADASPGAEISALAAVYKLCLNSSHAKQRDRLLDKGDPDDAEERS